MNLFRGYFARIVVVYLVVAAVCVVATEQIVTRVARETRISSLKDSLLSQAALLSDRVTFDSANLDEFCQRVREKIQARVTIIDPVGTVLGDSDAVSAQMENHLHRPEVQAAILSGTGSAIRHSESVDHDFLYVVRTVGPAGRPAGFIRLAIPLDEVNQWAMRLRFRILAAVFGLFAVAVAVSLWQTLRLRRLVSQVTEFSTSIARGDLRRRLILEGTDEFGRIAGNLNEVASELMTLLSNREVENDRLNTILKSVPDALLIIDPRDRILVASSAANEFFDRSLVGQPIVDVVRNREFLTFLEETKARGLAGERTIVFDQPMERHVVVKLAPFLHSASEPHGFAVLLHDITRLRKLEEVRRDFVANVSHEIKTPVTAIQGYAETLLDAGIEDADTARRFLEIILSNSQRMNRLVDDLLTISRLELGVTQIRKQSVDLADAIRQALENFEPRIKEKGLALTVDLPSDRLTVDADPGRLQQILSNLLDNAVKYTTAGGLTVTVAKDASGLLLSVKDTGIGIPDKDLPRIGERFYRVDPARSREQGGTGLGMAIVKHLVRAHGWRMEIKSTLGKGTTIGIRTG